jgi:hypothetical protein
MFVRKWKRWRPVAWMRMMGADSVGYHEDTVLGRGDDPVVDALEYYASRGETPMMWGGSEDAQLGLEGEVGLDDWRTVFGTGGARDPGMCCPCRAALVRRRARTGTGSRRASSRCWHW